MSKKNFLNLIGFLLLLAVCAVPIGKIFSRPADYRNYHMIRGFYEEPENTLDAVYIGSSNAYAFWNPLLAWESHGITVYSYTSNDQAFSAAPYLIEEVRKTQPDALIIVNVNSLRDTRVSESNMHYLLDNMPLSLNKLKLTKFLAGTAGYSFSDSMEFYFPILRYHERWSELTMDDFDFKLNGLKGSSAYPNYLVTSEDISSLYHTASASTEPEEAVIDTLNTLLDYCDENSVNILFVTVPRAERKEETPSNFLYLNDLIESRGYPVLNLMDQLDEMGIDLKKDYYNDLHTNIHGSAKFTQYLADYLVENFDFADKHGNEIYSRWDTALKKYGSFINPELLDIEHDVDCRIYDLAEPEELHAEAQESGIALTWAPVENADGYCVYRKKGAAGWKRLADVTETVYMDTQERDDSVWTYRVVPVRYDDSGEIYYGSFSYSGVSVNP